jgi:diguanylate cyclase (GGDEF)-like protein
MKLIRFFLFSLVLLGYGPASAGESYRIGVLAFRGLEEATNRWQPTVTYLSNQFSDRSFQLIPLTLDKTEAAVREQKIDFLLTNTGQYVALDARYELRPLATLKNRYQRHTTHQFGAVIFARSDRDDIRTLRDLKGKRFAAVKENAFGGFQMAWRELKDHGIDPFTDFEKLNFIGFPQDSIVLAVESGLVDAGTVRTDVLEQMADNEKIRLDEFKILNPLSSGDFPFLLSTRLYPEWPFAALAHVPVEVRKQIKAALLTMPADHPSSVASMHAGWSDDFDYRDVSEVFKELEVGPYKERFNTIRLAGLILIGLAILVLTLFLVATKIKGRNLKRTIVPASVTFLALLTGVSIEVSNLIIGEHEQGMRHTARVVGKSLANAIELEIQQKSSLARLLAAEYKKEYLADAMIPIPDLLTQVATAAQTMSPDYAFLMVADPTGEIAALNGIEYAKPECEAAVAEFAQDKNMATPMLSVHGERGRYHFDTMVHVEGLNAPIFFISFDLNVLAKHLSEFESREFEVVVVNRNDPNRLAFSADGVEQSLAFGESLSNEILNQALFETSIEGTDWRLEVLPYPERIAGYAANVYKTAFGFVLLSIIMFTVFLWRLHKEEDARMSLLECARTDSLTCLPNRRHLEEHFERVMAQAHRDRSRMAMFFIDLDGFKQVNDELGHEAGDAVLRTIADRFLSFARENEFVARLGGDEFCLLVPKFTKNAELKSAAKRLIKKCSGDISVAGTNVGVGLSVGIAIYPDDGETFRELMNAADTALYHVKNYAKGSWLLADQLHEKPPVRIA